MKRNRTALKPVLTFSFIIFGIYWIFFRKKPFVRIEGRIPYILPLSLNKTLTHYVKTAPSHYVLVLTGPYQSGKSRAMDIIAKSIKSNRLVFKVDFDSCDTPADVENVVSDAFLKAISPHKALKYKISEFTTSLKRSNINFSLNVFFDTFESLQYTLRPVLFAYSVDRLREIYPQFYQAACARLSRRALYDDYVPVIAEFRRITDPNIRTDKIWAKFINVPNFNFKEAQQLVKDSVFRPNELKQVYDAFNGHGGCTERVFEALKRGESIEDAILAEQDSIRMFINGKTKEELLKTGHFYIAQNLSILAANIVVDELTR